MPGTSAKERVKTTLSEVRTLVLGAQILLGFQYRASFEPGFLSLPETPKRLLAGGLILLVASIACMIAPSSYHRIAARGEATARMERYTKRMATVALVLFSLSLGANLTVVLVRSLGPSLAGLIGIGAALLAALCWFGPALTLPRKHVPQENEMVSTREKISELLTESRIILPGVQALLGFQFASFLTEAFEKLPPASKAANTASLLLLILSMVLLMTPTPYHRLAENGEDSEGFERIAERLVLASLPPLALGIAGDVFVVTSYVMGPVTGATLACLCALGMVTLWFGVPLLASRLSGAA